MCYCDAPAFRAENSPTRTRDCMQPYWCVTIMGKHTTDRQQQERCTHSTGAVQGYVYRRSKASSTGRRMLHFDRVLPGYVRSDRRHVHQGAADVLLGRAKGPHPQTRRKSGRTSRWTRRHGGMYCATASFLGLGGYCVIFPPLFLAEGVPYLLPPFFRLGGYCVISPLLLAGVILLPLPFFRLGCNCALASFSAGGLLCACPFLGRLEGECHKNACRAPQSKIRHAASLVDVETRRAELYDTTCR